MPSFGERLRKEREDRGISLQAVAEATRVRLQYLQALEADELQSLPGTVFNKGFVRSYADFIRADSDALVRAYLVEERAQLPQDATSEEQSLRDLSRAIDRVRPGGSRPRRSSPRLVFWVLTAGLLLAAGWSLLTELRQDAPAPRLEPGQVGSSTRAQATGQPTRRAFEAKSRVDSQVSPPTVTPARSPRNATETTGDREPRSVTVPAVTQAPSPSNTPVTADAREPRSVTVPAVTQAPSPSNTPVTADAREPRSVTVPAVTQAPSPSNTPVTADAREPRSVTPRDDSPSIDVAPPEPTARLSAPVTEKEQPSGVTPTVAVDPPVEVTAVARPARAPADTVAPELSVPDFGVGTGVVDRQLVGRRDRFTAGSRVWFWTRVVGGRPGDRVDHVWLHEGRPVQTMQLTVGGSHWRTQSYKTVPLARLGAWTVEARDVAGRVLAQASFVCTDAAP